MRQRDIHEGPVTRLSGIGEESLLGYRYGNMAHRFPALVEVVDVGER